VLQRGAGGTFRLAGVAPATAGSWSPGDLVAHIAVPAGTDGEHVYVSCRGADTLTVHAASPADGLLRALHDVPLPGACPRHFAVTDGFALVGHQASGSVSSLRLGAPGPPAPVTTVGGVPHPACLLPGGFS
jgi:6-phosphogluconolactonase (cycloisomerase 2 family)